MGRQVPNWVRLLVDSESSSNTSSGVRIDLDMVMSYKVENFTVKIINASGGVQSFNFYSQSAVDRLINYLDTELSVNMAPY